jgi:hypothetical protein
MATKKQIRKANELLDIMEMNDDLVSTAIDMGMDEDQAEVADTDELREFILENMDYENLNYLSSDNPTSKSKGKWFTVKFIDTDGQWKGYFYKGASKASVEKRLAREDKESMALGLEVPSKYYVSSTTEAEMFNSPTTFKKYSKVSGPRRKVAWGAPWNNPRSRFVEGDVVKLSELALKSKGEWPFYDHYGAEDRFVVDGVDADVSTQYGGGRTFYWLKCLTKKIDQKRTAARKLFLSEDRLGSERMYGEPVIGKWLKLVSRGSRNPGAAYHADRADDLEASSKRARHMGQIRRADREEAYAAAHRSSAVVSHRLGIPNPIHKSVKSSFPWLAVLGIGGLIWWLSKRNQV